MAHVLAVRVYRAWGVPDESDKNLPFVKVTIQNEMGVELQSQETTALTFGGDDPCWNENLNFKGLQDPAMYTCVLELRDKNDKEGSKPDGVAKVPLSVLLATDTIQQFREKISGGWFESGELKFGLCNFGTWGNGRRPSNKMSVTIISADHMKDHDGGGMLGLFSGDKNDPYVFLELEDEKGKVVEKLQTKVLQEAGEAAEWNETLTFKDEVLTFPQAYKLKLTVYDKDKILRDDCLGKVDKDLSKLIRKPEANEYLEELVDGKGAPCGAHLKFTINTFGTWGTIADSVLLTAGVNEGLTDVPKHDGYYLKVNVLHADGLAAGSKGNKGGTPICRLTLRDESFRTIKTVATKSKAAPEPKAKAKAKPKPRPKSTGKSKNRKAKKEGKDAPKPQPKPDVEWNESFEFRGIQNPGLCTLALNVMDADSTEDSGKRLGEHVFTLGVLDAKEGLQEFDEEIAGFFWKSTLKFQCENMGAWGNAEKPEDNKLYIRVDECTNLPEHAGGLIKKDVGDPYVFIELKDDEGKVIDKKETKVQWNAGCNPQFNEELIFEKIEEPMGCSIYIRVYDKDKMTQDDVLGHASVSLGDLPKTDKWQSYFGTTLGGLGEINFAMHTGNTWGMGTPVDVPEENAGDAAACCSTM